MSAEGAAEIVYTLENRSPLPVAAAEWELILEDNMCGGRSVQSLRGFVRGKSVEKSRFTIENARTGKFVVTTKNVGITDYLRLFAFTAAPPDPFDIVIYPKIFEVGEADFSPVETDGDSAAYSQNKAGSDVNEIFALHEYMEGDDLRKVHWKLSSKTDVLLVRDFSLPHNSQVILLLELIPAATFDREGNLSFCLDIATSLSTAFTQREIVHNLAWYDCEYDVFYMEQIAEPADLYACLSVLLEAKAYDGAPKALDSYTQGHWPETGVMLYYITANAVNADLFNEAAIRHGFNGYPVISTANPRESFFIRV